MTIAWPHWLVFGDSLSDNGNFSEIASAVLTVPVPFQPTYDPRAFSNGDVYADTLMELLGAASYENYALGGAKAVGQKLGANYQEKYSSLTATLYDGTEVPFSIVRDDYDGHLDDFDINLTAQVDRYLADLAAAGGEVPEGTTAILSIGANDFSDFDADWYDFIFGTPIRDFTDRIGDSIEANARRLADAGVDRIVLYTLPTVELFPDFASANWLEAEVADNLFDDFNSEIRSRATRLEDSGIDAEVVRIDILSETLITDSESHGFLFKGPKIYGTSSDPDWVQSEPDGDVLPVYRENAAADGYRPDQILFYDEIHPSAALHDMIAVFSNETLTAEIHIGSAGRDNISKTGADDFVLGRSGSDTVTLRNGADTALGGRGNDIIRLGNGSDLGIGGKGDDELFGGRGFDLLAGGLGDDRLTGGAARDILIGGRGSDVALGGARDDVFIFVEEALQGGPGGSSDIYDGGNGDDILYVCLTSESFALWENGADLLDFGLSVENIETISVHEGVEVLDDISLPGALGDRLLEGQYWGVA